MRHKRIYNIWKHMRQRCWNSDCKDYFKYGGRGIDICDEWNDYFVFQEWSLKNGYKDNLSIDRKDNNNDYKPSNCRWASDYVQACNKGHYKNNTSGYKGVVWKKGNNRWCARIGIEGRKIQLGYFDTALEGAIARDKFIIDNNLEHQLNGVLDGIG